VPDLSEHRIRVGSEFRDHLLAGGLGGDQLFFKDTIGCLRLFFNRGLLLPGKAEGGLGSL
jgi:hypothetical protein